MGSTGVPRFTLDEHPYDPEVRAEYGFDQLPLVGWFVETFYGARAKPTSVYDASQPHYDRERPLWGALLFLVQGQFFSGGDLEDALDALAAPEPRRASQSVRRVMQVVQNFKSAVDN